MKTPSPAPGASLRASRAQLTVLTVAVALVGVILAGLVLGGHLQGTTGGPATGRSLEHVHGVGVNPADQAVYAGTHHGLFRLLGEADPVLVGQQTHDFMGFTVVGPNHFLASGHPARGSDGPSSLGLIESTDGGSSWSTLSLAGAADFHTLRARHGHVYGYNALTGQLLVSADKTTWDTRSTRALADFDVSPSDPELIVATTEQGLIRSQDGGRTFSRATSPLLLLVSWAADGALIGISPTGEVHVSTDAGSNWQQRGALPDTPEAAEALTEAHVLAVVDGTVLRSVDGGRTFAAPDGG